LVRYPQEVTRAAIESRAGRASTEASYTIDDTKVMTSNSAWSKLLKYLVDLIGIEPMTSSMPWNSSNRKM
jgi:hypothetical protein